MKKKSVIVLIFTILIVFQSCSSEKENNTGETPKVLENESSMNSRVYLSKGGNIIDELFEEAMEKNPDLNSWIDNVEELHDLKLTKGDNVNEYRRKNSRYFNEAKELSSQIHNTELKKRIDDLIAESETNYQNKAAGINKLNNRMDELNTEINDFKNAFKIAFTLDYIKNYQDNDKAINSELREIIQKYEALIQKSNALLN